MRIEKIDAACLNPAEYNPRRDLKPGDADYEKLRRSIEEFGYVEPIIWNERTGNIIGGHQRFKILVSFGYTEIDCVVLDIDAKREKALNVALNKISGEFDIPLLTDLLHDLSGDDFDVSLTGFDAAEIADLFEGTDSRQAVEDSFDIDKATEEITVPVSRRGDVWQLGEHRLMCGDALEPSDADLLMAGDRARLIITDAPYNVAYSSGGNGNHPSWKKHDAILNDDMPQKEFTDFLRKAFANMRRIAEPGCMVYAFMSAQEWGTHMQVMQENGFHWSSTIIWNKDSLVLSRKDYHTKYEPIWYGWVDGAPRLCQLDDRKQSDVWDVARPKRSELHPTMKPIPLLSIPMSNSSKENDIIIDFFGGSGSALITAEQLNRRCRMMELSEKYVDVIVRRYIELVDSDESVFLLRNGTKSAYSEVACGG